MKNIDLNREVRLKDVLTSLSTKHKFECYIVGSQLNKEVVSKDLNIISVMKDDSFFEQFGMSYQAVQTCINTSEYSNMGVIKYISIVRQIEVDLKFKTMLNIQYNLMDRSGFDFEKPYLLIDNKNQFK